MKLRFNPDNALELCSSLSRQNDEKGLDGKKISGLANESSSHTYFDEMGIERNQAKQLILKSFTHMFIFF